MGDRATSTMLSYALTLTMITLLVAGVFVAAGGYVGDQHERSIRAELDVLGNRIASDMAAMDRLALADSDSTAELTIDLPSHVAGKSYRIEVDEDGNLTTIDLSTTDPSIEVRVTGKLSSDVEPSDLSGGDVTIVYDGTSIEVTRG